MARKKTVNESWFNPGEWGKWAESQRSPLAEMIGGPLSKGLTPTHLKNFFSPSSSLNALKNAPEWMQSTFAVGGVRAAAALGVGAYTLGNVRNTYNRARQGDFVGAGMSAAQVAGVGLAGNWLFKGTSKAGKIAATAAKIGKNVKL